MIVILSVIKKLCEYFHWYFGIDRNDFWCATKEAFQIDDRISEVENLKILRIQPNDDAKRWYFKIVGEKSDNQELVSDKLSPTYAIAVILDQHL